MKTETPGIPSGAVKGSILLADDEVNFRQAAEVLLREKGYHCDAVPDAYAAAALLQTNDYDVDILDIRMPGNTDLELAHDLAGTPAGPAVILITGYPSLMPPLEPAQLPCLAYLLKPFTVDELMAEVQHAVTMHKKGERET